MAAQDPGARSGGQAGPGQAGPGEDVLVLGKHRFRSRLILGTGKYRSTEEMQACHEASGAEMVTVAVRRLDKDPAKNLLNFIDRRRYALLPNTAGCYNAEDAVRFAHIAREMLETDLVKLEVIGDERTLLPDPVDTLVAAERLVRDGFTVLCYASDDPILCRRIEGTGVTSVMPAGSPIGSGQGVLNPFNIRIILETLKVPIIVDAGVGTASDVALAMELGIDGVLLNTAVALAKEPVRMARAMRLAVEAGREAYLAGRIPKKLHASASSPLEGMPPWVQRPS
ncbi:MAG: thiazole synthase [Planctomycetes bacterium]|nr:thiazole synthase [Planctomycetota bacterium]